MGSGRKTIIGSTRNWSYIPESHRCDICSKGKHQTNFTCFVTNGEYIRTRNKCNRCALIKKPKVQKKTISQKITEYLYLKYGDTNDRTRESRRPRDD